MKTDILVIGNGMFGSAATRHLAERGHQVMCIGAPRVPQSDADIQQQQSRVYSSHNDEARLTRRQDRNIAWAEVTGRAIRNYRELERRSGVSFLHDVGCMIASRPGGDGISADPLAVMNEIGVDYRLYDVGDRSWNGIWPDLSLPDTHFVAHEPAPAGYIRPKRLIRAQNVLATNAGAQLIDDTVVDVARAASGFLVLTARNVQVEAKRVVVAAGAFSNFNGLVPRTLDMTLKSEVVVLGEVAPADAARLALYPTVKFMIDPGELESIYMVPPVRYNDGRFYIKMGANTTRDVLLARLEDVQQWFATDTDPDFLSIFGPHLQALWPGVDFVSMRTEPCVITRTPNSLPLIEQVVDGLFVAAGGNGAGAKGSDAWGERIVDMMESQT